MSLRVMLCVQLMAKLQQQLEDAQAQKDKLEKDSEVLKLKVELKKLSGQASGSLSVLKTSKGQITAMEGAITASEEKELAIHSDMEKAMTKVHII